MSDYSGPYGRERDPSEAMAEAHGAEREKPERRRTPADRGDRSTAPEGEHPEDEGVDDAEDTGPGA